MNINAGMIPSRVPSPCTPNTVKNASSSPSSACTYGTHYPSRIFAGHLPGKVTASDLADFFRAYGTVLEGKVVLDTAGHSRRFGFVTFATPDDVRNVLSQESIVFNGKKINVGPAVKKINSDEDMTPPQSPTPELLEKFNKMTCSSNEMSAPSTTFERIVTVPPVNEPTDPADTNRPGNVWLKVVSEKSADTKSTTTTTRPPTTLLRRNSGGIQRSVTPPMVFPTFSPYPPQPQPFNAPPPPPPQHQQQQQRLQPQPAIPPHLLQRLIHSHQQSLVTGALHLQHQQMVLPGGLQQQQQHQQQPPLIHVLPFQPQQHFPLPTNVARQIVF